jgi:hypothetical protein
MAGALRWLFGNNKPSLTGLQVQTASNTLPVPVVWGRNKVAPNVLWYGAFQIHTESGGGGKGGLFNSNQDYTAAVIMGLCEGPIQNVGRVWRDQSVLGLDSTGSNKSTNTVGVALSLFNGTTPQAVWGYLAAAFPAQAIGYQGTAYVASSDYDLGSSATLSNHNFEIYSYLYTSGANGLDADPGQVILDFLTNAQYGVGFPAASIDMASLIGSSGDASLQTYCFATGLCISPCLVSQESAQSILQRWLKVLNCVAIWSGGQLKFIPYGDTAIVAGAVQTATQSRQIMPTGTGPISTPDTSGIQVCTQTQFVSDGGVINGSDGTPFTYIGAGYPSGPGQYGIYPPGIYQFYVGGANDGDQNTMVSITYDYALSTDFNPNITSLYSLTDDDYVASEGDDPVKAHVSDPYEAYNLWTMNINAADAAYNPTPIIARDQDSIEKFGLRMDSSVEGTEICDENVGMLSVQLMMQRAVYIRQTFTFKLSWEFCLLEPMDIVDLTDALLGLNAFPVRITDIEEADDGMLTITAEEFPEGVGTAPLYQTTGSQNPVMNRNAVAAPINPPIIFEPTDALAGGPEIWAAVSGSAPNNYGGCLVFSSTDSNSYTQIGTLTGYPFKSTMGVLTAPLPSIAAAAGGLQTIDETNTLAIDLSESNGALDGGSVTDMTSLNTLAYCDGELIAYQNATLTGANAYNLAPMVRGAYDTTIAAHATGANFARLNSSIIKIPYNPSQIGQQIYLKFVALNQFGAGAQDISDVAAYAYTIQGTALTSPLPNVTNLRTVFASNFEQVWWDPVSDFRSVLYEIRQGSSWAAGQFIAAQAHPPFVAFGPGTYWISPRATPASGVTVYSDAPQSITISGSMIVENLLETDNEQTANWPGTMGTGISVVGSAGSEFLELNPAIATTATYAPLGTINLGYVGTISPNITCVGAGIPKGQSFLAITDFLHTADILGAASSAFIQAYVEVSLSQDGVTFGPWQAYAPGQYSCWAMNVRAVLVSIDGVTSVALLEFGWTISVPARIDHYLNQSVPIAGLSITFRPDGAAVAGPFNAGPNGNALPFVNVSWQSTAGDTVALTGLSTSGVRVTIMNSGAAVARTGVNVVVEGF